MPELPPVTITLDHKRVITSELERDPFMALMSIQNKMAGTPTSRLVDGVGSLLVDNDYTEANLNLQSAFYAGASLAVVALSEADIAPELSKITAQKLSATNLQCKVLTDTRKEAMASLEALAHMGHMRHGEMRDSVNLLMEYLVVTTQNWPLGRLAFSASGYMLHQIDTTWDHLREVKIDEIMAKETAGNALSDEIDNLNIDEL